MRVLHVIPSIAPVHGGPSAAVAVMAEGLAARGLSVTVATTDDAGPGRRMSEAEQAAWRGRYAAQGVELVMAPKATEFYKVSIALARWLARHVGAFDVVHIHALFSFTSIAAARSAARRGVPYIVRPLGVLDSYGMTRRRPLLKRLSFAVLDGPALRQAAAVHFTSTAERDNATSLIEETRSAVIPLGIPQPEVDGASELLREIGAPRGRPRVLFLSRLDPKKNLEGLLRAIALLPDHERRPYLIVAGDGPEEYRASLRSHADALDIADDVAWLGPVAGARKAAVWGAADLFVLPSHAENFGIAAAEAMLAGLPCLLSPGVALAGDAEAARAVRLTGVEPSELAGAIRQALADPLEMGRMGRRARDYAAEHFSPAAMSEGLAALYERVIKAAPTAPALDVLHRQGAAH